MNTELPTHLHYQWLLDRVAIWAQLQPDIQAALVVGSRARQDRPADQWSDLDLVIITTQPELYLAQTAWLAELGTVWITFLEPTATGEGLERRVLFAPGLDVDFAIFPFALTAQLLQSSAALAVLRRGVRVLVDKAGIVPQETLTTLPWQVAPPPTPAEFENAIHDFCYHAVWTAKKLRRGELWTAKDCCDGYLKRLLLQLIEWHAQASHGGAYDTWHKGRFLEAWADPRAVAALPSAFAHYTIADTWRALTATMSLFRWLAQAVASSRGYVYSTLADERATALVATLQTEQTNDHITTNSLNA